MKARGLCLALAAVSLIAFDSLAWGQPPKGFQGLKAAPRLPDSVVVERDVQYGKAGERPLKLDLVLPRKSSEKPLPAIVFIHGGAWRAGDKAGGIWNVMRFVASGSYVGASVGYRLTGEAIWPAQIHDCKAAIRWLKANAKKYHIDPEKIGVWGSSAGGHLVSLLGTSGDVKELEGDCGSSDQSSRVACVVDFCGPSDFLAFAKAKRTGPLPSPADSRSPESILLGGPVEEKKDVARQASPVTYASADDPPFLIVHGTEDPIVPPQQAELLHAALKKAGTSPVLLKVHGAGHGLGGPEVLRRVETFLDKHLRGVDVTIEDETVEAPPVLRKR